MKKSYKDPLTKTEMIKAIAEDTDMSAKEVKAVLESLGKVIEAHIKPRAAGVFKLPGMFKIQVVKKPATKAKKGVPNPFRPGETMDVAAKPASKRVKILPLKNLKDMAQ
ncbi:MAG: HU family DNA-binding protein [Pseudomonadota bacterium]